MIYINIANFILISELEKDHSMIEKRRLKIAVIYDCVITKCDNSVSQAFFHISYYEVWRSSFIKKCDRFLLQKESSFTRYDWLWLKNVYACGYKVWHTFTIKYAR